MPLHKALAAAFEDEIVILDSDHGSLLLLDAWAGQIWRFCDGSTTEAIESSVNGTPGRVRETLQVLLDTGLVRQVNGEWIRGPIEWV
jgi:hypothetical protein